MKDRNEKKIFKEWLEKLQQESWQLELIISGLAIYGLFSVYGYLEGVRIDRDLGSQINFSPYVLGYFIFKTGILIFITNLLIHIVIRSLWIGAIGLRYVSGDINYDQLKYNKKVTDFYKTKIGSFDTYIEQLEKLSSIIFSYTFLLFFIFFSICIFTLEMYALDIVYYKIVGKEAYYEATSPIGTIHFFLGVVVAFDFISGGLIKRIKQRHFAFVYFWIYRYFGILTLSFLWRPILLNFLDLRFTKFFFFLSIPICFSLIYFNGMRLNNLSYFPMIDRSPKLSHLKSTKHIFQKEIYDELNLDSKSYSSINLFSIPSKRVRGPLFEVFVKGINSDDQFIQENNPELVKIRNVGMVRSSNYEYISEEKNKRDTDLDNAIDEIRKTFRDKNLVGKKRIENIRMVNKKIDSIQHIFLMKENEFNENNLSQVKQIIESTFNFEINEKPIDSKTVTCDFYQHPRSGVNGMLCFFPLDSLALGRNYFTINKIALISNDKDFFDTLKVTVPFIYEGL